MAFGRYWTTMTKAQQHACLGLWQRAQWRVESYRTFRRRFRPYRIGEEQGYHGGTCWGMFIGIEPDGYTHT